MNVSKRTIIGFTAAGFQKQRSVWYFTVVADLIAPAQSQCCAQTPHTDSDPEPHAPQATHEAVVRVLFVKWLKQHLESKLIILKRVSLFGSNQLLRADTHIRVTARVRAAEWWVCAPDGCKRADNILA